MFLDLGGSEQIEYADFLGRGIVGGQTGCRSRWCFRGGLLGDLTDVRYGATPVRLDNSRRLLDIRIKLYILTAV